MPFLIHRLSRFLRLRLQGWRLPLAVAVFVFLTSWLAMALVEPAGTGIAAPGTYWWYFLVTSATVGYGDVAPVTYGGRVVGVLTMLVGVCSYGVLLTLFGGAWIDVLKERRELEKKRGATEDREWSRDR